MPLFRGQSGAMRKKSFVPLFAVAFVVAIVSTGIFYGLFVGRLRSASSPEGAAATILVAARNLPKGTVLKAADAKTVPWAGPAAPAGILQNPDQIEGWTVIETIHENEPISQARVASKEKPGGGNMGIPSGMRAVSVHVYDSAGVLALLQPGHKVDIQVVGTVGANNGQGGEMQLKTPLEDMEVLSIERQPDTMSGRIPAPTVTLLATPKDAAILGLADASARIRLALRNPLDSDRTSVPAITANGLFRNANASSSTPATAHPQSSAATVPPPRPVPIRQPEAQVQLWVRLAGAGVRAIEEINTQLENAGSNGPLQVAAFRPGSDVDRALEQLEERKLLEVLSASRLTSANHNSVSLQAGTQWNAQPDVCGVRIQFAPSIERDGRLRLRVNPEITAPLEGAVSKRRIETDVEVADGQSFLVRGLISAREIPVLWNRLFPGRDKAGAEQQLLVLVTPKVLRSGEPVARLTTKSE